MKEADRKKRNEDRRKELYPDFAKQVEKVIQELEAKGLRPRIQDAWRSPENQLKAYTDGHSKLKYGFHNVTGKNGGKESLAVDLLDDDSPLNIGTSYILQVTAASEKHGLTTGARWGLPVKFAAAIDNAISTEKWSAPVKVGWDPVHIQPANVTVAEARAGKRPNFA